MTFFRTLQPNPNCPAMYTIDTDVLSLNILPELRRCLWPDQPSDVADWWSLSADRILLLKNGQELREAQALHFPFSFVCLAAWGKVKLCRFDLTEQPAGQTRVQLFWEPLKPSSTWYWRMEPLGRALLAAEPDYPNLLTWFLLLLLHKLLYKISRLYIQN